MKFSAVLLLAAASANAAVMSGKRFSNGAAIEAPRALDLAQDVRRSANTTTSGGLETRQATNATTLETRQATNTTTLAARQVANATNLETRQAGNATARSKLRRAAAANGTAAAARSVDGHARHLF